MNHALSCLFLVLVLAAGCTRANEAFCCIDPADCAAQGVQEASRPCTDGLSCVDNKCAASTCAASGCASTAPICEITTDTCVGCASSTDCMRFPSTDVCDVTSGSCVECVSAMDCDAATPVCDGLTCRTCKLDSECSSGACADNGTCVDETNVVYLAPNGTDALPCSKTLPCATLFFAAQQTNNPRNHIVFASGDYTAPLVAVVIDTFLTTATSISIHGGGAKMTGSVADGLLEIRLPSTLRDIELVNPAGSVLVLRSTTTVQRVALRGQTALHTSGTTSIEDVDIRATAIGIRLDSGSLRINRASVIGGARGISASSPTTIDFTNLLVAGTSDIGMDLTGVTGMAAFMTVTDTGTLATSGPMAIRCSTNALRISESIVYTSGSRPTIEGGCLVSLSIVGQTAFPGGMNTVPGFLNPSMGDYHLSGGSSARDIANAGPTHDFEGDPRPRGARFDIGADEAP